VAVGGGNNRVVNVRVVRSRFDNVDGAELADPLILDHQPRPAGK
jgi:hypothetical protein